MDLHDLSPMPFGTYKGTPLEEVPASYFHYLWTNGMENNHQSPVAKYIRDNLAVLKEEYPDGIW